ncbi:MAG: metalloregulator ArsR/SmtB family transcription factor [Firmicutes bacterium]|nr:metalloregulator ArsR/SmtB family transcription factor [Bacillota bacterium]
MASKTLVQLFNALSDDTRLKIVVALSRQESDTSCQILRKRFNLSQPAMSHHFKVLRQSRVIKVKKIGRHVYYSLNRERLSQLQKFINDLNV